MSESKPTIVWFRQDLRIADNPALDWAIQRGGPVIPVFIWAPGEEAPWSPGAASRYWLHQSLSKLNNALERRGGRLIVRSRDSLASLRALIQETRADTVVWNRRYEPVVLERDKSIKAALRSDGIEVRSFNSHLLFEPWEIQNNSGGPYQVFTQFWKTCLHQADIPEPLDSPQTISAPETWPVSQELGELDLEPRIDWAGGIREAWDFGEEAAHERLEFFLEEGLGSYAKGRDQPALETTSRLSPHLHFGEISPRQIWHAVQTFEAAGNGSSQNAHKFLSELGWREFSYHLLYHFPHIPDEPLREKFESFPWHTDKECLDAWQKGCTGYPLVDAGMRELWHTGYMHNRVRMVVASFLTKDLLIPWQTGARWFWDTLVDADLANNTQGWQWTAGCGADAAPYFRIFNPITQGGKYDPDATYIRRWLPELAKLPTKYVHQPSRASEVELGAAGVRLGHDYPKPIVDHKQARQRALEAFEAIKGGK